MRDIDCVADEGIRVDRFQSELKLAARNASEIEQVVDQSCLQLHVALYYLHIFYELRRKFWRVIFEVGRSRQRWCKRGAEFMTERREKIVLSLACFFRYDLFRFKFSAANLICDVACDFGISPDVAFRVAQDG